MSRSRHHRNRSRTGSVRTSARSAPARPSSRRSMPRSATGRGSRAGRTDPSPRCSDAARRCADCRSPIWCGAGKSPTARRPRGPYCRWPACPRSGSAAGARVRSPAPGGGWPPAGSAAAARGSASRRRRRGPRRSRSGPADAASHSGPGAAKTARRSGRSRRRRARATGRTRRAPTTAPGGRHRCGSPATGYRRRGDPRISADGRSERSIIPWHCRRRQTSPATGPGRSYQHRSAGGEQSQIRYRLP